jgi:hypothetical protein
VLLRKIDAISPFSLVQEFILQLLEADRRLQLKYHPRLGELQIRYSDFYYPQGEVPDTKFWHTPHYWQGMSI